MFEKQLLVVPTLTLYKEYSHKPSIVQGLQSVGHSLLFRGYQSYKEGEAA